MRSLLNPLTDSLTSLGHLLLISVACLSMVLLGGCGGGGGVAPGVHTGLADLDLSIEEIGFNPAVTMYNVPVGFLVSQLVVSPSAVDPDASVTVAGLSVEAGDGVAVDLAVGMTSIDIVVTEPGTFETRIYTLAVNREGINAFAQEAYAKASTIDVGDDFGGVVAIDGNTLAVTVLGEDSSASGIDGDATDDSEFGSGAVIVFNRAAGVWSQQAYLKASNPSGGDGFGRSLDLDGDTLVVGSWYEDGGATGVNGNQLDQSKSGSGAAYVFVRSGDTWSQQAYLKASNTGSGDNFGVSIAVAGDIVAVGADEEDSSSTGVNGDESNGSAGKSGAVYVFVRSAGSWSQQAYLKASNTGSSDEFGRALVLDGETLAVWAQGEDSNATGVNGDQVNNSASNSGAVYIFTPSAGVWSQQAYLKASNTGVGDRFGSSLALDGDSLAVGAHLEQSAATGVGGDESDNSVGGSGAVYIFARNAGTWSQQAYLKASNTGANDYFGSSVALEGTTLAVGAYGESSSAQGIDGDQVDNSMNQSGAVFVFVREAGLWSQVTYLKASNTGPGDLFGGSVSLDGQALAVGGYSEDGSSTGMNGDQLDNGTSGSGAAYIFR